VPEQRAAGFERAAAAVAIPVTHIGRVIGDAPSEGTGHVRLVDAAGRTVDLAASGYSHF
jgi:hypothetical protein